MKNDQYSVVGGTTAPEIRNSKLGVRDRILHAAVEIFSEQGKNGARIEHIAARADVNKALVYYHFKNKGALFSEAVKSEFLAVFHNVQKALSRHADPAPDTVTFLKQFIRLHFRTVCSHRTRVRFLIGALADDPEMVRMHIREMAEDGAADLPKLVIGRIEEGIARRELRPVNPKQLLISILGMNLFFFIARPIAEVFLDLDIDDDELFLEERLTSVLDVLLYGTVERRSA